MQVRDRLDAFKANVRIVDVNEEFENVLNETEQLVFLGGYNYEHGIAFRLVDPIAFKEEAARYKEAMIDDGIWARLEDETIVDAQELSEANRAS